MLSDPVPEGMQQSGSFPSQPCGQTVSQVWSTGQWSGGPPKQRMMPFWSALQTSFFP